MGHFNSAADGEHLNWKPFIAYAAHDYFELASRVKAAEIDTSPVRAGDAAFRFPNMPFSSLSFDLQAAAAALSQPFPLHGTQLGSNIYQTLESTTSSSGFCLQGSTALSSVPPHDQMSSAGGALTKQLHTVELEGLFSSKLAGEALPSLAERVQLTRELLQGLPTSFPADNACTPRLETCSEGTRSSLQSSSPTVPLDVSAKTSDLTTSTNRDLPVQSIEDSDTDIKNPSTKRRKSQQKKVIYVPISGDGKQKCEAPPSDLWAWRKYGQKPIKGSPYPRGYYRCSSSKGCSARKQVERSRTDPSMLIITYTTDHNHLLPGDRTCSEGSAAVGTAIVTNRISPSLEESSQDETICEPPENIFSCIINSPNAADQMVVSSLEPLQVEESSIFHGDVDLCLSRSNIEEDDFFDDLGELPELATIFRKSFVEDKASDSGMDTNVVKRSHSSMFDWPSNNLLVGNDVAG